MLALTVSGCSGGAASQPEWPAKASYTFSALKPGLHQVRVIIADPQHKPMPGMAKILQVSVN